MSERTLSVLDGSTFVVGDRLGDVREEDGREHGFFCEDTRFLSRWVLRTARCRWSSWASIRVRTSPLSSS